MSTSNHLAAVAGLIRGAAAEVPDPSYIAATSREVSIYLRTLEDFNVWADFLQAPVAKRVRQGSLPVVLEAEATWAGLGGIATPIRLVQISRESEGVAS